MSSAAIIEEILHLPPAGQAEVIQFALRLARERALAPDELASLAQRMVDSDDLAEVEKLKSAIMRGFYGGRGLVPKGLSTIARRLSAGSTRMRHESRRDG